MSRDSAMGRLGGCARGAASRRVPWANLTPARLDSTARPGGPRRGPGIRESSLDSELASSGEKERGLRLAGGGGVDHGPGGSHRPASLVVDEEHVVERV